MLRRDVFLQQTQKKIPLLKNPKNFIKKKRLTNCHVSDFMNKTIIRKEPEHMQAALQRSENGEKSPSPYFKQITEGLM